MPTRLNILFVTSWYPNDKNPFAGIFVKEHAKAVSAYNNVTVLSVGDKSRTVEGLCTADISIEDNIKTIRLTHKIVPIPKITPILSGFNTLRYMFKLKKNGLQPDIIHANIYTAGISSVVFGKLIRTKVIVTEHWSGYARDLLNRLEIAKARFTFNHADMILPVSSVLQQSLEKYGIEGKFEIVPNVLDTNLFKIDSGVKANHDDKVKRILIVGEQIPIKGIPSALEALKRIKTRRNDFFLNIISGGENKAEYENLVISLGLKDHVKFHGFQPKAGVAQFMQESDFLISPSYFETFGCVAIEAMACGTPIVASHVGNIPTLIPEYAGILVEPGNISKLASAIEHMLDNHNSYPKKKMSDYVKSNFSIEIVGKKLDCIYREILEIE